eukprot:325375_1
MAFVVFLCLKFILLSSVVLPMEFNWPWMTSSTKLLRPDWNIAICHFDDMIFLMGGFSYSTQFMVYNISSDTFIDKGDLQSTFANGAVIFGNSQYYTQINHMFYFLTSQSIIYSYNLQDRKST